jgi:hypothetical protein
MQWNVWAVDALCHLTAAWWCFITFLSDAACFIVVGPVYVIYRRDASTDNWDWKSSSVCVSEDGVVQVSSEAVVAVYPACCRWQHQRQGGSFSLAAPLWNAPGACTAPVCLGFARACPTRAHLHSTAQHVAAQPPSMVVAVEGVDPSLRSRQWKPTALSLQPLGPLLAGMDDGTETYLTATMIAYQMSAATSTLRYTVECTGSGEFTSYSASYNDVAVPQNQTLYLQLGRSIKKYNLSAQLDRMDVSQTMAADGPTGSYTFYPFDSYQTEMYYGAYLEAALPGGGLTRTAVPICFVFYNTLALFDIKNINYEVAMTFNYTKSGTPDYVANGTANIVVAKVAIARTTATKFFSVFVVILMWGLSSSVMALAIDHLFLRPREPVPPTVGFSVAFLFALPSLRNVQPDVPVIGSAVDVSVRCWHLLQCCAASATAECGYVLPTAVAWHGACCWHAAHAATQAQS